MKWKNVADQPIVAFEIVILKYDPFDRRLIGGRWTVTGRNSADWTRSSRARLMVTAREVSAPR
jgi:hypothetical protein